MKRLPVILIILAVAAGLIVLIWPHTAPPRGSKPLTCYVGGTMTPVFNALEAAYVQSGGPPVDITSADSGELLATIEMHLRGDLYVAHDPFMNIAMNRGLGVNAWTLGELFPVMIVRKGNPKNIQTLADLMRPDVRVYLTDYENSTLGHMLPVIFRRAEVDFDELNRLKQIPTHRSGSWVANQLIMNQADVALVWQAVAFLRRKDLDIVRIDDALPVPNVDTVTSATGKGYPVMPVKVNIVSLACSKRQRDSEDFVTFVTSDTGKKIFEDYGFKVTDLFGRQPYANGVHLVHPD